MQTFEGKFAVDSLTSQLKLPTRKHAHNILQFLLTNEYILPVYHVFNKKLAFKGMCLTKDFGKYD